MNIQATTGTANAVNALKTAQTNAVQEAKETAAITRAEAAKGDQQAIRKLAAQKQQQQQQSQAPKPVSPEGAGKTVNTTV